MLKMLHQYAACFQSHGVKPGDKVLVHVDDSLGSFIAMYGVVFAGGVVIPSELASEQGELLMKIKEGKASHVLTTPNEADLLKELTQDTDIRVKPQVLLFSDVNDAQDRLSAATTPFGSDPCQQSSRRDPCLQSSRRDPCPQSSRRNTCRIEPRYAPPASVDTVVFAHRPSQEVSRILSTAPVNFPREGLDLVV
ncbi:long-chain-fatty-acid--CoA ligase-like [Ixodes scapularis]